MKTDLEIARGAELRPITEIAAEMGIPEEFVEPRGYGIAKIKLEALDAMGPPRAKYVLVTAVNPTPFGEGKTTVSVGLAQGFKLLGSHHSAQRSASRAVRLAVDTPRWCRWRR
jgi:formate--tetrahydrofolate ligase